MLFIENVKLALSSIRSNKMRAFLTMLGIIIGISSVIAITSIGSSAKGVVSKEFDSYGKNMILLYPDYSQVIDALSDNQMISVDDINRVKQHFGDKLQYIAPIVNDMVDVQVGRTPAKVQVVGVDSNYDKSKKIDIIAGRMINEADVKSQYPRIVIEKRAAEELFHTDNPVGQTLSIPLNGQEQIVTIVGVFNMETTIFSQLGDGTYLAYVPFTLMQSSSSPGTYQLEVYVNPSQDVNQMGKNVTSYLDRIKNQNSGFYIYQSAVAQSEVMSGMLGTLSMAIGAIAAISLVVGGIGIMNIMLVSVTERTREIGIRKSLGARTKDILLQFLIESVIISAIGGMVGVMIGVGVAALGMHLAGIALSVSMIVILLAVAFSALVGVFFGLYPARKAAKLDPIEALRYE